MTKLERSAGVPRTVNDMLRSLDLILKAINRHWWFQAESSHVCAPKDHSSCRGRDGLEGDQGEVGRPVTLRLLRSISVEDDGGMN